MNEEMLQQAQLAYGVENWAAGYFDINSRGNIIVRPSAGDQRYADLKEIVDQLIQKRDLNVPILLRFPQILSSQLKILTAAYQSALSIVSNEGQSAPRGRGGISARGIAVQGWS
jgi:arginine decarboxylase